MSAKLLHRCFRYKNNLPRISKHFCGQIPSMRCYCKKFIDICISNRNNVWYTILFVQLICYRPIGKQGHSMYHIVPRRSNSLHKLTIYGVNFQVKEKTMPRTQHTTIHEIRMLALESICPYRIIAPVTRKYGLIHSKPVQFTVQVGVNLTTTIIVTDM